VKTLGWAAPAAGAPLEPFEFQRREPGPLDVAIDIKFAGICHSDIHQARHEWGGGNFPMVPGHEIAGVVSAVGGRVTRFRVGDRVGVGCMVDSDRTCDDCREDLEQFCPNGVYTYNDFEHDGVTPTYGGYSQHVVVQEHFVARIPDALPLDAATPLLCAGITTYSPLRHWRTGPGMRVAVLGLGGLGHMAVKLAHAMGAEVSVLSHSRGKEADARRFGANAFHVLSAEADFEPLARRFDLILDTVGSELDRSPYLRLVRRDGSLVLVGLPEKPLAIEPFAVVGLRRSLAGSTIGGMAETQEMLDFCALHGIVSDIELIPIQKVNEAYDRVVRSDVRYRFVIDIASLEAV
jgi:alcohol dehydrogenase (NADP+)